jgi:hypothetical protein
MKIEPSHTKYLKIQPLYLSQQGIFNTRYDLIKRKSSL